jgi:hypothetical protein
VTEPLRDLPTPKLTSLPFGDTAGGRVAAALHTQPRQSTQPKCPPGPSQYPVSGLSWPGMPPGRSALTRG